MTISRGLLKETQQTNGNPTHQQQTKAQPAMSTEVAVALIAGGFSVVVALLEFARRQNNRDHAYNSERLDHLISKVDRVDTKLDGHITWHAHRD